MAKESDSHAASDEVPILTEKFASFDTSFLHCSEPLSWSWYLAEAGQSFSVFFAH